MKYGGRDWSKYEWAKHGDWSKWSRDWSKWKEDAKTSTAASAERFANDLHSKIKRDFDTKMARKFEAKAERFERKLKARFNKQTQKYGGVSLDPEQDLPPPPQFKNDAERQTYERARKRAQAEAGFFMHLMWYGIIIGFLFIINLMTGGFGGYPWFIWPALGWGFGVVSHFAAVYGWRWVHQRVFDPAIAREVQREVLQEKEQLRTEKQASLDELTATFAHEIRNPIAAAKSLVQQMGEDPTSHENVEYAKVALDELARVERSVSHLLKYAKEEDYKFENVNLAWVVDGALTQMRSKLEANSVLVSRAYLSGPTCVPTPTNCGRCFRTSSTMPSTRWNPPPASAGSSSRSRTMAQAWRRSGFATTAAASPTTSSPRFSIRSTRRRPTALGSAWALRKK